MIDLNSVLLSIYKKSPFQKKKLEGYISQQPSSFFKEADKFIFDYSGYLEVQGLSFEYAVDAYLKMCGEMVKSQIFFMKNDKYPLEDQAQAFEEVYDSQTEMHSFMVALALSQYLWKTHYKMFKHFQSSIENIKNDVSKYLEIGPGHGLYFQYALKCFGIKTSYRAVDISKTSLDMTKNIISYFSLDENNISYVNDDMLNISMDEKFDFITMGEVLEHVNFPQKLLLKLKSLLYKSGYAFISTCVNCPTIDHVYHYRSVSEIQEMVQEAGLIINNEKILPVENLPMEEIIAKKITINYSAIISNNT
jgi:ubiquinone/menaquinone biosynthesis C-methylase UbiE